MNTKLSNENRMSIADRFGNHHSPALKWTPGNPASCYIESALTPTAPGDEIVREFSDVNDFCDCLGDISETVEITDAEWQEALASFTTVLSGDTRPLTRASHYSIVRLHDGHEMPTTLYHDYDTFAEAKAALIERAEQYCYDNDLGEAEAAEFMKNAKYCCSYIDDVYSVFIAAQFDDGTIRRVDCEAEHAHQ